MSKKKTPTPPNERFPIEEAKAFFAAYFYGEYHIPSEIKPFGWGWRVVIHETLSTYDFSGLTRLVLLAHDRCIRAGIGTAGMRLRIHIHKRERREDDMTRRHPNIDEAIKTIRGSKYYDHGTMKELLD